MCLPRLVLFTPCSRSPDPNKVWLCSGEVLILCSRRLVFPDEQPLLLLDHPPGHFGQRDVLHITMLRQDPVDSLHDVIDILPQDVQRLGIDVRVSDEGAEVDFPTVNIMWTARGTRGSPNNRNRCSAPYNSDIALSGLDLLCSTYCALSNRYKRLFPRALSKYRVTPAMISVKREVARLWCHQLGDLANLTGSR